MTPLQDYRSKTLCEVLIREIHKLAIGQFRFMEVCGGHTMAIRKFGIPSLLPDNISLLSGPGCPVCVTSSLFIDQAIFLSRIPGMVICTYGDLMRVRGSVYTLEEAKAMGSDIRVVLSSLHALNMAQRNPDHQFVFLGIGFETTAPATAAAMLMAKQKKINNFLVLSAHKLMPPAMNAIISAGTHIDGYICPGHVCTITGTLMYEEIVEQHGVGCVVSGFEPLDLLQTVLMLVRQMVTGKPQIEIQYTRAVKPGGNPKAMATLFEVFEPADDWWRGLGIIKESGLTPRSGFRDLDASRVFCLPFAEIEEPPGCICGHILKGTKNPSDCPHFGKTCTPETPVGACMVSAEGSCQTHYRYGEKD